MGKLKFSCRVSNTMSHPNPGAPKVGPKKAAKGFGKAPPKKGWGKKAPPAGRGGGPPPKGGGAPAAPADACVKCAESTGGQKFCPHCGEMQPGAHLIKSPRAGAPGTKAGGGGGGGGKYGPLDHEKLSNRFVELCKTDTENQ